MARGLGAVDGVLVVVAHAFYNALQVDPTGILESLPSGMTYQEHTQHTVGVVSRQTLLSTALGLNSMGTFMSQKNSESNSTFWERS